MLLVARLATSGTLSVTDALGATVSMAIVRCVVPILPAASAAVTLMVLPAPWPSTATSAVVSV